MIWEHDVILFINFKKKLKEINMDRWINLKAKIYWERDKMTPINPNPLKSNKIGKQ